VSVWSSVHKLAPPARSCAATWSTPARPISLKRSARSRSATATEIAGVD
jgi:hypothetical protein